MIKFCLLMAAHVRLSACRKMFHRLIEISANDFHQDIRIFFITILIMAQKFLITITEVFHILYKSFHIPPQNSLLDTFYKHFGRL